MPFHDYQSHPSNYFDNIKKNNLSKWEKIEQKRTNDLQNFLNECMKNNKDKEILQELKPKQHEMINKN
jgi:hypothetical protein